MYPFAEEKEIVRTACLTVFELIEMNFFVFFELLTAFMSKQYTQEKMY